MNIIEPNIQETIHDDMPELQHIQKAVQDDMTELCIQETTQVDILLINSYDVEQVELSNIASESLINEGKSWEDIDTIMEFYGKKHGFSIIKKQLIWHEDGNIRHYSYGCEFSGRYQPKKQININSH
ncbi:11735_t:CDS:2 [Cetraspora pellucida]|uniref:11735_t:CDS:1 n=1 Tax=Cetraspora pellucida TaxID=1433469 RepID=A0ACA9MK20_9GLOM|nr:11735_t:CDS:2 [Cetraspora pellucida]